MPKAGEYTASRRMAMQGVMWLVLGGAVGLASLVDRSINPAARNPSLGAEQSAQGGLHYRLPATWDISPNPDGVDRAACAVAEEPSDRATQFAPRAIVIYRERVRNLVAAADYLNNSRLLGVIFHGAKVEAQEARLDGNRAVEVNTDIEVQTDAGPAIESDIVICSVFPNHQAVTVQLQKPGLFNAGDKALFEAVARAIRVDR